MTNYALDGLVKRCAQLAGDIERTYETLRKMVADLEVLDAAILQFDPSFPVEAIIRRASVRHPIGRTGARCPGLS